MTRHWYRIEIVEGLVAKDLFGTSDLEPAALVEHITSGQFVVLGDIAYNSGKGGIVPASVAFPQAGSVMYINPKSIVSVLPFTADPRSGGTSTG